MRRNEEGTTFAELSKTARSRLRLVAFFDAAMTRLASSVSHHRASGFDNAGFVSGLRVTPTK